ncbi:MAG: cyanophycin synthetase [Motiliproteus sp.]|jgi:cyanophycin synthetase
MANTLIQLTLDDSRRLTGKSLLWDQPGAIIDAFVEGIDKPRVVNQWQVCVRQLLDGLGWQGEQTCYRLFEDGISVAISAPLDALYAACDINMTAWEWTCAELTGVPRPESLAQTLVRLRQVIIDEANPALLRLIALAKQHNAPWLSDDDDFSLGYGASVQVWPVTALPDPERIDWRHFKTLPLALVTGTNGKSTSVRLLSQMVQQSGRCCGVTSTDFVRVGEHIIDRGDYSGPGGARILLRHPDTETAILEMARGGILRRGLPVDRVDAALITNIAADHLGQYGINTLDALTRAKAVVAKALDGGTLVLNADDPQLVALAPELEVTKCWFSLNPDHLVLQAQRTRGGAVCFLRNGLLVYGDNNAEEEIIGVDDIPMTLNGAARHNIQNALGAIGLAKSLGLDSLSIACALRQFCSSIDDNPGRGNQFQVNDATVIMDFAHNAHSMNAMAATLANMPAQRKLLMLSMPGDRSDQEITESTQAVLAMQPDLLVVAELEVYLRGRELGEVPRLIADAAVAMGLPAQKILFSDSPYSGAKLIVEQLQRGDLTLLLALSDREEIIDLLGKVSSYQSDRG